MVYATCSVLAEENQRIAEEFLSKSPGFRLSPAGDVLRKERIALDDVGDYLELWPHRHGTDGFFAAVFERVT